MFRSLTLLAFLLVSPSLISAQQFTDNSATDPKPEPVAEKKALSLLETVADQVASLRAPANRARAECAIADLLWTRDEKRARGLFNDAATGISAVASNIDFADQQAYQEFSLMNQLRQEVVNRIAQHDPEMALSVLRETRLPQSTGQRWNWYAETETAFELNLATLIAARDPAQALALARANLKQGVTYGLPGVLVSLQQKDPKAAQSLYRDAVDQIKTEGLRTNQNEVNAVWSLVTSFQPPQADEETYRDLIGALATAALSISLNSQSNINLAQNLSTQIKYLLPQLQKYAPGQVPALEQWSRSLERSLDPATRMYREISEVQNGTVDEILTRAPKYPPEFQSQLYSAAAWKAFSGNDVNRARQIVADLISDPVQRRQMLEQFDEQLLQRSVNENKIAEARQRLSSLKTPERKIQVLLQFASSLLSKGDKRGALDLLNEARSLVLTSPSSSAQMMAQMQLARAFAPLDLDQSFTIMQPLIVKANELIAAAAALDGFDNRYLKEGEWMTPGGTSINMLVNNLNESLAVLAQADFDRALSLASQLERPEIRLIAQLGIARSALGGRVAYLPMNGSGVVISRGRLQQLN